MLYPGPKAQYGIAGVPRDYQSRRQQSGSLNSRDSMPRITARIYKYLPYLFR